MAIKQSEAEVELKRESIDDVEYLVIKLEGSKLPWPEDKPAGLSIDDETYDSLKDIISKQEVVVALGVWNDYVLLSIGESTDHLSDLGGDDLFVKSDSFEPLLPAWRKKTATWSASATSRGIMKAISPQDLDEAAEAAEELIEKSDDIDDELKGELSEDAVELADDLKPYLPKPGAIASCTLKTDTGFESFTYNWSENALNGTLPLELTNHVGSEPIASAFVGRGVSRSEAYAILAKWVGKGIGYFEGYGLAEMEPEARVMPRRCWK